MRFSVGAASVALYVASAQASLWCKTVVNDSAFLSIYKNDPNTGENSFVGPGTKKDANGDAYLTSTGNTSGLWSFQACDSKYLGVDAELTNGNGTLTVHGKVIQDGKCLTRNSADGGVVLATCAPFDGPEQENQFFTTSFPYYAGSYEVAGRVQLQFVKSGYYLQKSSNIIYESSTKPASTWYLIWQYTSD